MTAWESIRLGDLLQIKHGFAFKGAHFSNEPGAVVLTPGNFEPGGGLKLRPGKDRSYDGEFPSAFELKSGDLLVVMTDLTQEAAILGAPAFVPNDFACLHNQRLGKIIDLNEARLDCRFLYYLCNTHEYRGYLRSTATGATVKHTSPGRIYDHVVSLPPLETQRRIASILGAYDDLIEVNRRRVAVLEEMARGLFEGAVTRQVGSLPPPSGGIGTALLPENWEIKELGSIAQINMGQSPKSEELNKEGSGVSFHQGVTDFGQLFPSRRVFCAVPNPNKIAEAGDILFSVRAPVGRINLATEDILLGRGVSSIRSNTGDQHFLIGHLRATFHEPDLIGNGAIYKAVGRKDIDRVPIVFPPLRERQRLNEILEPLYSCLWTLSRSNEKLEASRDLLLPRLISGQLSVEAAERQLEDAA